MVSHLSGVSIPRVKVARDVVVVVAVAVTIITAAVILVSSVPFFAGNSASVLGRF
jgi:hypothetical protein